MAAPYLNAPANAPRLRLVRDEDAPPYDAESPAKREPFGMMPFAVFDKLAGDGHALAVYAILVKHADKEGKCWPSVATICEALGWSKKLVLPAIQRLVDAGLVAKEKRQHHGMDQSNLYRITAYVRVVPTETPVSPTVTLGGSHGDLGCHPQQHELDTSELEPKELEPPPVVPQGTPKPTPKRGPDYDASFLTFWAAYLPNDLNSRSKKPEAAKVWASLSADEQAAALDAIPAFAAGSDWQRGFVPGAQVWLRSRKWEYPPRPVSANGTTVAVDWNDPVQVESYRRRIEQENLRRIHG